MNKVVKTPSATRQVLCCLKHPDKNQTPLLPLAERDHRKSPLYSLVHEDLEYTGQSEEERASELISEWMGPGPWPLRFNVEIASTHGSLHPTNMNKKGNITVSHVLKVMIRVEKEDAGDADDSKKKKVYDIVIQYPFHLLSVSIYIAWYVLVPKADGDSQHLCNHKYTSLPPYSSTWNSIPTISSQTQPSGSGPSATVHEVSVTELESSTPEHATPTVQVSRAASREREQLTRQFERLIAGQEAETGEAPPSYTAATSPAHVNHSHLLHV